MAILMTPRLGQTTAQTTVTPDNGKVFTEAEAEKHVEGLVERMPLPDGRLFLINHQGAVIGFPINALATAMAGQNVRGPVLLCEAGEYAPAETSRRR